MKDGGPAFPMCRSGGSEVHAGGSSTWLPITEYGMSLRDYFAAAALPAALKICHDAKSDGDLNPYQVAVTSAFRLADAMLAERDKS